MKLLIVFLLSVFLLIALGNNSEGFRNKQNSLSITTTVQNVANSKAPNKHITELKNLTNKLTRSLSDFEKNTMNSIKTARSDFQNLVNYVTTNKILDTYTSNFKDVDKKITDSMNKLNVVSYVMSK
jgi:hypothetical protein